MTSNDPIDITKIWNWNMDDTCVVSCANVLIAHMHVINAITLIIFLILCYLITCIINFIKYQRFTVTTQTLFFTSVLVYSSWNLFFGFPIRNLEGDINEISLSYKSYGLTQFMSIIIATIILFLNRHNY